MIRPPKPFSTSVKIACRRHPDHVVDRQRHQPVQVDHAHAHASSPSSAEARTRIRQREHE
jgi:hypothetical protein